MKTIWAQKAKMGSTEYFIAKMSLGELVDSVGLAIELPEWEGMTPDEKKQRQLDVNKVVNEMCPYFTEDKDRFFNGIVVDVHSGYDEIKFEPISKYVKEEMALAYEVSMQDAGFLFLPGKERLIALDGQHRLLTMKICLKGNSAISAVMLGNRKMTSQMLALQPHPELADEEISVILVKGDDILKIRKIFNRMNKYARQNGRGRNIITADDDVFAFIARRLFSEGQILYKIGKNELVNWKSNTLSQRSKQLTTVSALYTVAEILAKDKGWTSKTMPENDRDVDEAFQENVGFWRALFDGMDTYKEYLDLTRKDEKISSLRDENLLMKPATHMALAHVAYFAKQKGIKWPDVVTKLNQVDWSMSNPIWFNILVIPAKKKKMIKDKESIKAAGMVISYMVMDKAMSGTEVSEVREIISDSTNGEKNDLPQIIP